KYFFRLSRYLSISPTFCAILFSSSAASAAAKNRTIRPQGKTVNAFSGIFFGEIRHVAVG
ncbi:TPA: hypothetical protein ACFOZK_000509, partial [Neisseria meningitidis]